MKLSDLKVGDNLGISVLGLKVKCSPSYEFYSILENNDGHIDDIIVNITETYIEFHLHHKWRIDISLLYEKGLLEKELVPPKKWYIKRNKGNYQTINEWFNNNSGHKKKHSSATGLLFYPNCSTSTFQQALSEGYKELSFEDFKEYVLNKKQQKVMFTKKDWIERKCVIKFDISKREVTNKFLKECNGTNSLYTSSLPYIVSTVQKIGYWSSSHAVPDNLPLVTIDELLNPNNMIENKKIIGYKQIGNLVLTKEETEKVSNGQMLTIDKKLHPEAFEPIYEETIELGGYKVNFNKKGMSFDGATFSKNQLTILEEVVSDNPNISIRLKSVPVNLEMLKKLIENCK